MYLNLFYETTEADILKNFSAVLVVTDVTCISFHVEGAGYTLYNLIQVLYWMYHRNVQDLRR